MKKLKIFTLLVVSVLLLTGCSLFKSNNTSTVNKAPAKGNCIVTDCIQKLDTKASLEDVTKVMGFDGELVNEGNSYKTYKWVVNEETNETLQAIFYTTSTSISITFKDDLIKNPKVDFSKYDEIKTAMNNKETVTYDQLKKSFGAEGTLIEQTSYSTKYRLVNEKGGYLNANFLKSSGKCTMILGRI